MQYGNLVIQIVSNNKLVTISKTEASPDLSGLDRGKSLFPCFVQSSIFKYQNKIVFDS